MQVGEEQVRDPVDLTSTDLNEAGGERIQVKRKRQNTE